MPGAIVPMLATAIEKPFDDPDWLYEIKWDGYRAVAYIQDSKTRLVSRNQNDLTRQYPELENLAASISAKSAVLDGEVVALDEQGRASFSLIQQRTGLLIDSYFSATKIAWILEKVPEARALAEAAKLAFGGWHLLSLLLSLVTLVLVTLLMALAAQLPGQSAAAGEPRPTMEPDLVNVPS